MYRILAIDDKYYPQYKSIDMWAMFKDRDSNDLSFIKLCKAYRWLIKLQECENVIK
mgnify:FL=1